MAVSQDRLRHCVLLFILPIFNRPSSVPVLGRDRRTKVNSSMDYLK